MRIFFLQLFFSFWLATIAIFVVATALFPSNDRLAPEALGAFARQAGERSADFMLRDYQANGCTAHALREPAWILLDGQGKPLCGQPLPDPDRILIREAMTHNVLVGKRLGQEWVQVLPVVAGGSRWYLLGRSPALGHMFLPPLPRNALPISIIVTFAFAYLLTRPLRALSQAFRRFTAGDLTTRLPVVGPSMWGRFDSADVRTLMVDFNHMADRVTELIEAQKMLIRDISHELRSPLARLRLALELAREGSDVDPAVFDRVEHETERVNALIGEMLTLSLLENTGAPPRMSSFSMELLLEQLVEEARLEADARGCNIHFSPHVSDAVMCGQPEMLARALENILRNAIRYTVAGSCIEVELDELQKSETDDTQEPLRTIVISIRDTGPGIPEAQLPQVFRPFYRVDMARSETSGGFGVGLAIAERAVNLHGGRIRARNRPEGGLDVQIFLMRTERFD